MNELPANKPYLLSKWGERASDQESELAAKALLAAKNSKQQFALLRIFARRRFPLDVQTLLELVDVEQDRVGWAAVQALARVTHPAVRALALRLVGTRARWRQRAINLMAQNYEDGGHPHLHPVDRTIALQIDSIPMAIKVRKENGLLIAQPVAC